MAGGEAGGQAREIVLALFSDRLLADNGVMKLENGQIDDRRDYDGGSLDESSLTPAPNELFERWLSEAFAQGVRDPNAMVLSTVGADGMPSSRVVLAKVTDSRGIVFYTNYSSRKGREISRSAKVSLLFHWRELDRVVRIEGRATRVSEEESDEYFNSRPLGSRIGAVSPQSTAIGSREELVSLVAEAAKKAEAEGAVERPSNWGGYLVVPTAVEFWQGRPDRLHDRFRYRHDQGAWVIERLAP